MGKYVLYQQAGSGNHGCEALVRTIVQTVVSIDPDSEFTLVSSKPYEDTRYGLDKIKGLKIVSLNKPIEKWNLNWFKLQIGRLLRSKKIQLKAKFNLDWIEDDALFIAMGGDNYCYNKGRVFYDLDSYIKGKKVLWGCSIEPDDLDCELVNHLKQFSAISVRETVSYEALERAGLKNITLIPDTAFALPTAENALSQEYVGVNISPLIMNYSRSKDIIYKNYCELLNFILQSTGLKIMLLPHVVTDGNDDRLAIKELLSRLDIPKERMLIVGDCNCMELKGYISKCNFFVGARTHATIAAYSNGIPTLVVGYSVKSKGIAKDIYGEYSDYVVSVDTMKEETDLLNAYEKLLPRADEMREMQEKYTKLATTKILGGYKDFIKV